MNAFYLDGHGLTKDPAAALAAVDRFKGNLWHIKTRKTGQLYGDPVIIQADDDCIIDAAQIHHTFSQLED